MNDLYIYYQVRNEDAAALASRVRAMQARLGVEHGVAGQLKRRPEEKDGLQTWMEIYPATGAGFDAALAAAVADAALAQLTAGKRHTEIFTDLSTCA
jgi:hypothetical protein